MEPCLFRHGKWKSRGRAEEGQESASMEPCLFRHGKAEQCIPVYETDYEASMEPCLFRHGKQIIEALNYHFEKQLQWSHVFSDMVRSQLLRKTVNWVLGFNGAMSFQTW